MFIERQRIKSTITPLSTFEVQRLILISAIG